MTDQERINDIAWRSFLLGARALEYAQRFGGTDEINSNELSFIGELAGIARQISDGELTLKNPTEDTRGISSSDGKERIHRLSSMNIQFDRELAIKIYGGFRTATATDD